MIFKCTITPLVYILSWLMPVDQAGITAVYWYEMEFVGDFDGEMCEYIINCFVRDRLWEDQCQSTYLVVMSIMETTLITYSSFLICRIEKY